MTLEQVYAAIGGDYKGVMERLPSADFVRRFALKFLQDDSFPNLKKALEEKDAPTAFRAAHTLKGVCQNLGFDALYAPSSALTEALRGGSLDGADELFPPVEKEYQYKNFGQTSNKGVELSVSAVLFDKKNFSLNFNANIAYNRNRIDKLNTDSPWQSSNWSGSTMAKYEDFRVEKGGRLGEVWGYKTNGYYTVYDPVTNPTGELVWAGSEWGLKDGMQDNSPTITGGKYYPGGLKLECDKDGNPLKQRLGNTIAPTTGGFGFDGRVGNFDFNVFFNYSLGNVIVNGTKLAASFRSGSRTGYNLNNDFRLSNRYTWIDPETGLNLSSSSTDVLNTYGDMTTAGLRLNEINANANMYNPASATTMQLTDYAVEKASFLRLNNITIGYSLPKTIVRRAFMQNVRIYLTGYNLFCWTNYSGADPEVDTSSKKNAMTPGIDYAAYPKSRTFVGGINVTF